MGPVFWAQNRAHFLVPKTEKKHNRRLFKPGSAARSRRGRVALLSSRSDPAIVSGTAEPIEFGFSIWPVTLLRLLVWLDLLPFPFAQKHFRSWGQFRHGRFCFEPTVPRPIRSKTLSLWQPVSPPAVLFRTTLRSSSLEIRSTIDFPGSDGRTSVPDLPVSNTRRRPEGRRCLTPSLHKRFPNVSALFCSPHCWLAALFGSASLFLAAWPGWRQPFLPALEQCPRKSCQAGRSNGGEWKAVTQINTRIR